MKNEIGVTNNFSPTFTFIIDILSLLPRISEQQKLQHQQLQQE